MKQKSFQRKLRRRNTKLLMMPLKFSLQKGAFPKRKFQGLPKNFQKFPNLISGKE